MSFNQFLLAFADVQGTAGTEAKGQAAEDDVQEVQGEQEQLDEQAEESVGGGPLDIRQNVVVGKGNNEDDDTEDEDAYMRMRKMQRLRLTSTSLSTKTVW